MSKSFVFLLFLIFGGLAAFVILPKETTYEISDSVMRLLAPDWNLPPDGTLATGQDAWIAEYQSRGYKLKCYGGLGPEELIDKSNDYMCWALIRTAYDNIPARSVAFFFTKNELRHVKLEFPSGSFAKLQDYLGRRLGKYPRLDEDPRFGSVLDIYGQPLMIWGTPGGEVITSKVATAGKPMTLLWSSKRALGFVSQ